MNYGRRGFLYGIMIAAAFVVFASIFAWIFMLLWNWLIPVLFNGPILTYWQALGLLVLTKILFGFGGKKHWGQGNNHWKQKWRDKCASMSHEERNRIKNHFMHKWNCKYDEHQEENEDEKPAQE